MPAPVITAADPKHTPDTADHRAQWVSIPALIRLLKPFDWPVARKMGVAFGLLIALLGVSGAVYYRQYGQIRDEVLRALQVMVPLDASVVALEVAVSDLANQLRDPRLISRMEPAGSGPGLTAEVRHRYREYEEVTRTLGLYPLSDRLARAYDDWIRGVDQFDALVLKRDEDLRTWHIQAARNESAIHDKLSRPGNSDAPIAALILTKANAMESITDQAFNPADGPPLPAGAQGPAGFDAAERTFATAWNDLVATPGLSPGSKVVLEEIKQNFSAAIVTARRIYETSQALAALFPRLDDERRTLVDSIHDVIESAVYGYLVVTAQQVRDNANHAALLLALFLGAGIAVGTVSVWGVTRAIARPVRRLVQGTEKVGRGDLAHRIAVVGGGELGQLALAFNQMVDNLAAGKDEREALIAKLEDANAEMEQFIYTVSHDLKGPLITIRGFMDHLLRDVAAGEMDRLAADSGFINNAVDNMQQLLEGLLELSRIGRFVDPPETVDVGSLARDAVDLLAGSIEARGVHVEIARDMPVAAVDRRRMLELLQNLIENAVKFMGDQPQPRIEVGCNRENGKLVCYVRDNGMGIDPRYHRKIFGLFECLDPDGGGSGVGLALAKRIVEVYEGRIWVESDGPGRGSTFYFTFPGFAGAL